MADEGKLKLIGKLGLDLSRLHTDVQTLENLIQKTDKNSKQLGKSWQGVATEMKKAFENLPIKEYLKALEKFEKAQKSGLDKMSKNEQKDNEAKRRRDEKHQNTMNQQNLLYNAKIEHAHEQHLQKMAQGDTKFQLKQLRDMDKHQSSLSKIMSKSYGESGLMKRFNSLTDFVIASGAIYGTASAVKQMIEVNREFEIGQMDLQRILKATTSEMEKVKEITLDVAKATGNATKDVQDIENLWIRTGVANIGNLKELTELTAIGLNTAQFKDAEDSVGMLVGAVNQMANGDFSQAQAVLDSWVRTADQTAVKTTRDLAEAISRAGSQGKQLGLTFHDLNAMTGILAERMSIGGEKVGTALKSVFSRIQDPRNYQVLEKWGVKVTEIGTGGKETFRNFTDVMDELNAKFKSFKAEDYGTAMSEIQKAMGGTHQRAVIANLIEGWDRYGEIVSYSLDSAGFAMQQNEVIMQTFDAQVKVMKANFVELALAIGQSGLMESLSGLVGGVTESVKWFNDLQPHVKNTIIVTLELATAMGALNLTFKRIFQVSLMELITNFTKLKTGTVQLAQAEELLNIKVQAGSISEVERTAILKVLRGEEVASTLQGHARTAMLEAQTVTTYAATGATTALMTAISAGLIIIPILIGFMSTYKQSQEEISRNTLERIKNTQDEVAESDKLISEYDTLTQKMGENKDATKLSADEKSRMNEIEVRFGEIYPTTVNGIDAQSRAYSNQINVIRELNAEKRKQLLDEAKLFVNSNKSEATRAKSMVAKAENNILNAKENLSRKYVHGGKTYDLTPNDEQIADYILKQRESIVEYKELLRSVEDKQKLINEITKLNYEGSSNEQVQLRKHRATNTSIPSSGSGGGSNSYFDPEDFDYNLDSVQHDFNMGKLNKSQYAQKLRTMLADYKDYDGADEKKIWGLEEQIFNLTQEKASGASSTTNWKKDLPSAITTIMDDLEHKSKMDTISNSDYAKQLETALGKYKNQLDQKAIWGIEEKIYGLKKSNKPDVEEINFDDLQKSINAIEREITLLEKEEEWLNTVGAKKSTFFPIFTKQIENHNKANDELISLNKKYSDELINIDKQLKNLDPTSLSYDDTVKKLTQDKKKLTDEIDKNTFALKDNALAIEKINIQMQDMIEDTLKSAYNLQKDMAEKVLDGNHTSALEAIKDEQEDYNDRIEKRISSKQKELEQLDEQIEKEEYLKDINELQANIDKAKKDTRFAYIDEASGKEIYTYDREKVSEFEKDLAEKEAQHVIDEKRKSLQAEIDNLEEKLRKKNEYYDKSLADLEESQRIEKESFDQYWTQRLDDENISREALNLIQQEGYDNALAIAQQYFSDMQTEYDTSKKNAYDSGLLITNSLKEGLFKEINSVISSYKKKLKELASLQAEVSNVDVPTSSSSSKTNSSSSTSGMKKYHTGGFIGGQPINPKHEVVAKFLQGELITSLPALDKLSVILPQMSYNNVAPKQGTTTNGSSERPIVIQIDKLTPNDFDDFMRSIDPYIDSHK